MTPAEVARVGTCRAAGRRGAGGAGPAAGAGASARAAGGRPAAGRTGWPGSRGTGPPATPPAGPGRSAARRPMGVPSPLERRGQPAQLLLQVGRERLGQLLDRGLVDLPQPLAAGVVERCGPHLVEQLLHHRADPHDLGRLVDRLSLGRRLRRDDLALREDLRLLVGFSARHRRLGHRHLLGVWRGHRPRPASRGTSISARGHRAVAAHERERARCRPGRRRPRPPGRRGPRRRAGRRPRCVTTGPNQPSSTTCSRLTTQARSPWASVAASNSASAAPGTACSQRNRPSPDWRATSVEHVGASR